MHQFFNGKIPGLEYILVIAIASIMIVVGFIYFLSIIFIHRKKKLNNYRLHLISSILTTFFSGLIYAALSLGFIVTV